MSDGADGEQTCNWNYRVHVTCTGGGWGDPHITTVDGVHYDFQSAGEFTALREDDFEVQTRQRPVPTATVPGRERIHRAGGCVSIYSAVALRIGSNRVSLAAEPQRPARSERPAAAREREAGHADRQRDRS